MKNNTIMTDKVIIGKNCPRRDDGAREGSKGGAARTPGPGSVAVALSPIVDFSAILATAGSLVLGPTSTITTAAAVRAAIRF